MGEILRDDDRVLNHLRDNKREYLYRIAGKPYWGITTGGKVASNVVERLIECEVLKPVYSNTFDAYGLRQTIDVEASLAARRINPKAELIYAEPTNG